MRVAAFVCALVVLAVAASSFAFNVDPAAVSVTGFSAGGYFAVQYQLAHSSSIAGAAVFAGGPYYCAQDEVAFAVVECMTEPLFIEIDALVSDAQNYAQSNEIDDLSNLANHKVFVFSGTLDTKVYPGVVQKLADMYTLLGVSSSNILTDFTLADEHGFPTLSFGNECSYLGSPWINNCNYDGAGTALQQIYGKLNPPTKPNPKSIQKMPQAKFTPNGVDPASISLDTTLYAYIPTACLQNATCKLHIVFHGCEQYVSAPGIGTVFIQNAGFNGWAEANNIIVVYPQTIASLPEPFNPEGCWDWWGYNEPAYATQGGSQITFVNNIINFFLQK